MKPPFKAGENLLVRAADYHWYVGCVAKVDEEAVMLDQCWQVAYYSDLHAFLTQGRDPLMDIYFFGDGCIVKWTVLKRWAHPLFDVS